MGAKGAKVDEEKGSLLARLPLLKRFSQAAEDEVQRRGLLSGMNSTLEQANIPMAAGEAIMAMVGLAAVAGIMVAIFNGLIAGLVSFLIFLLVIVALIRFTGSREKRSSRSSFPTR
jgi:predicted lipid-binding transport protein (Tim44 family)